MGFSNMYTLKNKTCEQRYLDTKFITQIYSSCIHLLQISKVEFAPLPSYVSTLFLKVIAFAIANEHEISDNICNLQPPSFAFVGFC